MGNKWIIDVLADLKAFAVKNDLPLLADQLGDVTDVALAEIHASAQSASQQMQGDQTGTRRFLTQAGASRSAG